jgi:hypothetical protein
MIMLTNLQKKIANDRYLHCNKYQQSNNKQGNIKVLMITLFQLECLVFFRKYHI